MNIIIELTYGSVVWGDQMMYYGLGSSALFVVAFLICILTKAKWYEALVVSIISTGVVFLTTWGITALVLHSNQSNRDEVLLQQALTECGYSGIEATSSSDNLTGHYKGESIELAKVQIGKDVAIVSPEGCNK